MDRHLVTTIWIGGAALALLVFLIGPDNFLAAAAAVSDALDRMFHGLLSFFGAQAYNAIRAATIAVYAVFLVDRKSTRLNSSHT